MHASCRLTFLTLALCLVTTVGCSRSTTTTETTTTRPVASSEPGDVATTQTTEKTVTTEDGGCGGVLSCTVDVVGEVIALPFRAVGALFRAIFSNTA